MKTLLVVTHEVKEYSTWKQAFDEGEQMRNDAGLKLVGVFQAADNQNMVTVITEAPNVEVAQGMTTHPELKATMEKAGVISAPEFKVLNNVN